VISRRTLALLLSLVLVASYAGVVLAQIDEYEAVELPYYGVASEVPAGWQPLGNGRFARAETPADPVLVAIQSAPLTIDELWPILLPQFALDEVPAPTATYSTAAGEWTLYRFDVASPVQSVTIGLALAEQDGATGLVLLQSTPDEYDDLHLPVLIAAIESFAPLVPEPTADATLAGYSSEDVVFPGGSEGVELAATLTLPDSPGPHPVAVLVSGSGGQDRDESLPVTSLRPFAEIAHALASAGVGVLRYDDRGIGQSSGTLAGATLTEIASDAAAAIDYLEGRDDVDGERVGIVGHSEGGLVAAMLGANDGRPAFLVSMAGPAVRGADVLRLQNLAFLEVSGLEEAFVEAYGEFLAELYPLVIRADADAARALTMSFFGGAWDLLSEDMRAQLGEMTREDYVELQTNAIIEPMFTNEASAPWMRSFLDYDPGADWARVTVPVLGLYGAKDLQVLSDQNEPALRARLAEAGNDDVTTVVFDDANHLFQDADTGSPSEYASLEPDFTADFLPTLVDWVVAHTGVAE
jgi:pimeloyl-ACP methyl ester carboxylesterase